MSHIDVSGQGSDQTAVTSPDRVIRVRGGLTDYHANLSEETHDNKIITSQYTWWNFVPVNLLQQFSNKANLYFLMIGILQALPFSTTTNGTPTIYFPLAFIVLVSAARAAAEDRQKHIADDARNMTKYWKLRSSSARYSTYSLNSSATGSSFSSSSSFNGPRSSLPNGSAGGSIRSVGAKDHSQPLLLTVDDQPNGSGYNGTSEYHASSSSVSHRHSAVRPVHSSMLAGGSMSGDEDDDREYWDTITGFPHDESSLPTAASPGSAGGKGQKGSSKQAAPSPIASSSLEPSPSSLDKLALDREKARVNNKHFRLTHSGDIKCGSIIKVFKNQMIPCDMILLGTSETKGHCFIDKANLNGETSLEVFSAPPAFRPYCINADGSGLRGLDVTVTYEPPSSNFEQFRCSMTIHSNSAAVAAAAGNGNGSSDASAASAASAVASGGAGTGCGETVSVDHKGLLLRETVLRNTSYVFGLSVYTGDDTKIRKSISEGEKPALKNSRIMRLVDKFIVFMFLLQASLCLTGGIYSGVWQYDATGHHNYLQLSHSRSSSFGAAISSALSWVILLSTMVPISLVVSAQMVKFIQSIFINMDLKFWHPPIRKGARCNTSTIHEDLGLVDYIFSDKTGTLTQNKMEFRYSLVAVPELVSPSSPSSLSPRLPAIDESKTASPGEPPLGLAPLATAPSNQTSSSFNNGAGGGGVYGGSIGNVTPSNNGLLPFGSMETDIAKSVRAKMSGEAVSTVPWSDLLVPELMHQREGPKKKNNSCCARTSWLSRFFHTTEGFYDNSREALDVLQSRMPSSDGVIQDQSTKEAIDTVFARRRQEKAVVAASAANNPQSSFSTITAAALASNPDGTPAAAASSSPSASSSPVDAVSSASFSSSITVSTHTTSSSSTSASSSSSLQSQSDALLAVGMSPAPREAIDDPRLLPAINPLWLGSFEIEERRKLLTLLWQPRWEALGTVTDPVTAAKRSATRRYLTHMALSTTAKPFVNPEGKLDWQFESAEELAMVRFAAACGFVKQADPTGEGCQLQIIEFNTPDLNPLKADLRIERYHQIGTFGFSSKRARVTVIWQRVDDLDPDQKGVVHVMSKGQDTVLMPLLYDQRDASSALVESLKLMCANGLRTLVAAYAEHPAEWWSRHEAEYTRVTLLDENEAKAATATPYRANTGSALTSPIVSPRPLEGSPNGAGSVSEKPMTVKEIREAFYEYVEKDAHLKILGCIAMEDKLQNLVPESVRDFGRAGIKVWMITGDKLETARNIALACNLVDADMTMGGMEAGKTLEESIAMFSESRLVEVTGHWASLANNEQELSRLFDVLDVERTGGVKLKDLQVVLNALKCTGPVDKMVKMFRSESTLGAVSNNREVQEGRFAASPGIRTSTARSTSSGTADGNNAFADDAEIVSKDQFIALMKSSEISLYDAVKADVDSGIALYNSIDDHDRFPIALLVNREAFRVMFPGKAAKATDANSNATDGKSKHKQHPAAAKAALTSMSQSSSSSPSPSSSSSSSSPSAANSHTTGADSNEPTPQQIEQLKDNFFLLASVCKSVVFARAEPAMKKRMVSEMMLRFPEAITLAIGDGANDTEMITTAHIGIGIAGVEGTAATNSSDYALGTFRMLHTLLFVHGFWCYKRVALLVNFMFYKAALLSFSNFFFGSVSAFSGQQFFSDPLLQLYNVLFTAAPIVVLGIFDKALPADVQDNNPAVYREAKGKRFRPIVFAGWIGRSFLHSLIAFMVPYLVVTMDGNDILGGSDSAFRGQTYGHWYTSTVVMVVLGVLPNIMILFIMDSITLLHVGSVFQSILFVWLAILVFSSSPKVNRDLYGHTSKIFNNPTTWFIIIIAIAIPVLLELTWKYSRLMFRPTLTQVIRERVEVKRERSGAAVRALAFAGQDKINSATAKGYLALDGEVDKTRTGSSASAAAAAGLDTSMFGTLATGYTTRKGRERRQAQEAAGSEAARSVQLEETDEAKWKARGKAPEPSLAQKRVQERLAAISKNGGDVDADTTGGDAAAGTLAGAGVTDVSSPSAAASAAAKRAHKRRFHAAVVRAMLQLRNLTGGGGFHSAADQRFQPRDSFAISSSSSSSSSSTSSSSTPTA